MTQTPGLTIRRGTLEDAGLLSELGARTFSETFAADNTAEDLAAYIATSFNVARQTDELKDPASTFLIAEVDGRAAGYAKLHDGEPEKGVEGANAIELVRLYVLHEWLGRGIGQQLMRAQAFYRKWDFRTVGEHVFQLGADLQRDLLMERAL